MKRFALAMLSVCAVSVSGCCWPGYWAPFGGCSSGGCSNGQCAPGMYGTTPTGWQTGGYPAANGGAPVAYQPMFEQQVAYPQPTVPTMAVESLPTYR